jgi:hypothetical protein
MLAFAGIGMARGQDDTDSTNDLMVNCLDNKLLTAGEGWEAWK